MGGPEDGSHFEIDRDCVIGRDPHGSDAAQRGLRPVSLEDPAGLLSRAHVEVRTVNGEVVVVDRGSTNGVFLREPAQRGWTPIAPWEPATWRPGCYIQIGGRILRLQAGTAPLARVDRVSPGNTLCRGSLFPATRPRRCSRRASMA